MGDRHSAIQNPKSKIQNSPKMLLAIEGGGTKTRILLADAEGRVCAKEAGGPANGLYIDRTKYVRELRTLLGRIKRAAGRAGGCPTTAGLAGPMDVGLVKEEVSGAFPNIAFAECGESEIALALYGLDEGISLVAGTGASCRALGPDGCWVSCGGFGPQFGDEGSGYWIGRLAVSAVMRAQDGRGPETVLDARLLQFFGISSVAEIFRLVDRSGHVAGPRVAAFAPCVFEAAREGDGVAKTICSAAGRELGRLVLDTARQVAWARGPVPLVLTGGMFHAGRLVLTPLRRVLSASGMAFDVYPEVTEPAEGILKVMLIGDRGKE